MRCVVTTLELAAAATTVVTALCGLTVVAGVGTLPCAMVVLVAIHVWRPVCTKNICVPRHERRCQIHDCHKIMSKTLLEVYSQTCP
jgi:hypothetical protein